MISKKRWEVRISPNIRILEFLNRMDLAYAAADVIISRAGAGTIAELCIVGKPVILVPSPNVAEDHQTKNAKALVADNACVYVADRKAVAELTDAALELLNDSEKKKILSENIARLALPDADDVIAKEVIQITVNLNFSLPPCGCGGGFFEKKMELQDIKRVYLIGIGGIGMSGLARYFAHLGCIVCGYDKTSTDLTDQLHNEGIQVIFDDREDWIPLSFQTPNECTLIIYTPAIPQDSAILNFFKNNGFELFKRSQVLGMISQKYVYHCRCRHAW